MSAAKKNARQKSAEKDEKLPTNRAEQAPQQMVCTVTREQLIRLAESADGMRGGKKTLALVCGVGDGSRPKLVDKAEAKKDNMSWVLEITTDHHNLFKEREHVVLHPCRAIKKMQLDKDNKVVLSDIDPFKVDAWFRSDAAIDKFVVPYYSRVRGVEDAKLLWENYTKNDKVIAFFHEPDSEPGFGVDSTDLLILVHDAERKENYAMTVDFYFKIYLENLTTKQ